MLFPLIRSCNVHSSSYPISLTDLQRDGRLSNQDYCWIIIKHTRYPFWRAWITVWLTVRDKSKTRIFYLNYVNIRFKIEKTNSLGLVFIVSEMNTFKDKSVRSQNRKNNGQKTFWSLVRFLPAYQIEVVMW